MASCTSNHPILCLILCFLMMRAMSFCFLVLFLQFLCLVGVSSRHLDLQSDFSLYNQGITQNHNEGLEKRLTEIARADKEIKKMGSRPPSCERKCYGCMPCEAIQVPTITGRVGVQYTNYEPEGWKCKCGPAFYSP